MYRRSSRIMLWILTAVVVVLVPATLYAITETNDARSDRCDDIVAEREGDRGLWFAIVAQSDASEAEIAQFLRTLDEFKPELECDERNIPQPVTTDGVP